MSNDILTLDKDNAIEVARRLEARLIRIEAHIESLERSVNLAQGGLHVLVWLGGTAATVAGVVIAILSYLHLHDKT